MKALVFDRVGEVKLREVDAPTIVEDTDVVLRVTLTAICGSDLHLMHGHIQTTPGYVLGHEYVGIVEQVGAAVKRFKRGDRVVGAGAPFCGLCDNCRKGHIYRCLRGGILGSGPEYGNLNGTHAEYVRIPHADASLIAIPGSLTDEQVLFVGDILSTGYFSVIKANVTPGSSVAIFGAGPVGLCAVAAAKLFNPKKIILVGRENQYRLDMGKKLGATHTILSSEEPPLPAIMSLTDGRGADAVIEAVGSASTIQEAVRCAGIGSCVSIVGVSGNEVTLPMFEIFMKNLRIETGIVDLKYMRVLMDLIECGHLDLTPLVTHRMSLDSIESAMEIFEKRADNVIKIAIKP